MMPLIDAFICTPLHLYNLSTWERGAICSDGNVIWDLFFFSFSCVCVCVCVFIHSLMYVAKCAKTHGEKKDNSVVPFYARLNLLRMVRTPLQSDG